MHEHTSTRRLSMSKVHFILYALLYLSAAAPCLSGDSSPSVEIGGHYNHTLAVALVQHASTAYTDNEAELWAWNCSRCTSGVNSQFKTVDVVKDEPKQLLAYVGVEETLDSIVICFRGTHVAYLANWIADLYFLELNLKYPGVEHAYVHWGFYSAYHNTSLRQRITEAVLRIRGGGSALSSSSKRPPTFVSITGHSLGAALATLCALDLVVNFDLPPSSVHLATFGCPRLGNKAFSEFFRSQVPAGIRLTHNHDLVVHLPPATPIFAPPTIFSYYHVPREVWLYRPSRHDSYEVEKLCDDSGEDLSCSRSVMGTSISDHLYYFGVPLCNHMPTTLSSDLQEEELEEKEVEAVASKVEEELARALKARMGRGGKLERRTQLARSSKDGQWSSGINAAAAAAAGTAASFAAAAAAAAAEGAASDWVQAE